VILFGRPVGTGVAANSQGMADFVLVPVALDTHTRENDDLAPGVAGTCGLAIFSYQFFTSEFENGGHRFFSSLGLHRSSDPGQNLPARNHCVNCHVVAINLAMIALNETLTRWRRGGDN